MGKKKDAAASALGAESANGPEQPPATPQRREKPDKREKPEKREKSDKREKSEKPAKSEKPKKIEKRKKIEKAAKTAAKTEKAEKPKKADKTSKSDKSAKSGRKNERDEAVSPDAATAQDAPGSPFSSEYGRLVPVIGQLVALVELHDTRVRRSVLDTYISAIVGGIDVDELVPIDLRTAEDAPARDAVPDGPAPAGGEDAAGTDSHADLEGEMTEMEPEPHDASPEPVSAGADESEAGLADDADDIDGPIAPDEPAASAGLAPGAIGREGGALAVQKAIRAAAAVALAGSAVERSAAPAASSTDEDDEAGDDEALRNSGAGGEDDRLPADTEPRRKRQPAYESEVIAHYGRQPASDLPTHRTLRGLANMAPPSNNDQRNIVIATWLQSRGHEVTPKAVTAGYERMGWRVPVNIGSSLRQTIRKGLLALDEDDRIHVTRGGAAHFG